MIWGVIKLFLTRAILAHFKIKLLPYKSYGVNPLDLTGFLTEIVKGLNFGMDLVK